MEGKFIVIEGLDGSGKTTQRNLLVEHLLNKGIDVVSDAEPTKGYYGKICREILGGRLEMPKSALATTFVADRIDHNQKEGGVFDMLGKGKTIICDRYYYSNLAYQGVDVGMKWLKDMNTCPDIKKPDLCIFLDLAPEVSMERITANRKAEDIEVYETLDYLTSIRQKYKNAFAMCPDDNIVTIDASGTIEEVFAEIRKVIDGFLG